MQVVKHIIIDCIIIFLSIITASCLDHFFKLKTKSIYILFLLVVIQIGITGIIVFGAEEYLVRKHIEDQLQLRPVFIIMASVMFATQKNMRTNMESIRYFIAN